MSEVTLAELERRLNKHEDDTGRRFSDTVSKAVYERDMNEIRKDIGEINGNAKWQTRLMVGNFFGLVIALLIWVVQQVPG